jgi:uncharacterized membrane protein
MFWGIFGGIGLLAWLLAPAAKADESLYVVDGLALGASVNTESNIYKEYSCQPSEQYRDMTVCRRYKIDNGPYGQVTSRWTILHDPGGRTVYINKTIEPAFLNSQEADAEIERLSAKFGERAQVLTNGMPAARIATWGDLKLVPLGASDLEKIKAGESPHKGFMVSYLENFSQAAQAGLAVFTLDGGSGFVWSASFDDLSGRGILRFLAADAPRMSAARIDTIGPDAAASVAQTQVTSFGAALIKKPVSSETPEQIAAEAHQQRMIADEAVQFANASKSQEQLETYVKSCVECVYRSQAEVLIGELSQRSETDARERKQYQDARDNISDIKAYIEACVVCSDLNDASTFVRNASQEFDKQFFFLSVCDYSNSDVDVSIMIRADPIANFWIQRGWWSVQSGSCRKIGPWVKGEFYVTARNGDGTVWSGSDKHDLCLFLEAFTRNWYPLSCRPRITYTKFRADADDYTWNLN